jgi:hypothetical protein
MEHQLHEPLVMGFPGKAGDIMPSDKVREDGLTCAVPYPAEGGTELRWEQSQSAPPLRSKGDG